MLAPGAAAKAGAHGASPAAGTGLQAAPTMGPGIGTKPAQAALGHSGLSQLGDPQPSPWQGPSSPRVPLGVTFAAGPARLGLLGTFCSGHFPLALGRTGAGWARRAGAGNGLERGQAEVLFKQGAESWAGIKLAEGQAGGAGRATAPRSCSSAPDSTGWGAWVLPRARVGRLQVWGARSQSPPQIHPASQVLIRFIGVSVIGGSAGWSRVPVLGVHQHRATSSPGEGRKAQGVRTPLPAPWLHAVTPQEHHGWAPITLSPPSTTARPSSPPRNMVLSRQLKAGHSPIMQGQAGGAGGPVASGGDCSLVQQLADAPAAEEEVDALPQQPQQPGAQAQPQGGIVGCRQCHHPRCSPQSAQGTGSCGPEEAHGRSGISGV